MNIGSNLTISKIQGNQKMAKFEISIIEKDIILNSLYYISIYIS